MASKPAAARPPSASGSARSSGSKTGKKVIPRDPIKTNEVAQNKIWREFCEKLDTKEVLEREFTIDPQTTIPITEKPNRFNPSFKISESEYKQCKKLLEDLNPIKNTNVPPPDKYEVPLTTAQEYGWNSKRLVKPRKMFEFGRHTCEITEFAAAYLEAMHTTPFSKKGFVPRYVLKQRAAEAAAKALAAPPPPPA